MAKFVSIDQGNARHAIDDKSQPPWCMVPAGGSRTVKLEDGAALSVDVAPEATTTLKIDHRPNRPEIKITATTPGTATLRALRNGKPEARLDVSVFEHKDFYVSWMWVNDSVGTRSRRKLDDVRNLETVATNIYLPQMNLDVKTWVYGNANVPFDISKGMPILRNVDVTVSSVPAPLKFYRKTGNPRPCIASRVPGPQGCRPDEITPAIVTDPGLRGTFRTVNMQSNLYSQADRQSDFTFFLVTKITGAPDVKAYTTGNCCILPDTVQRAELGFVAAHEFGHWLLGQRPDGQQWHSKNPEDLMYESSALGWHIRKDEALQMALRAAGPKPQERS